MYTSCPDNCFDIINNLYMVTHLLTCADMNQNELNQQKILFLELFAELIQLKCSCLYKTLDKFESVLKNVLEGEDSYSENSMENSTDSMEDE